MNSRSGKGISGSVIIEASVILPFFILCLYFTTTYFSALGTDIKAERCIYAASGELILDYSDYSLFKGIVENAVKKAVLQNRFEKKLEDEFDFRGISGRICGLKVDFSDIFDANENEGYLRCRYSISGIVFEKSIFLKAIGSGISRAEEWDDIWSLEPMLRGRIIIQKMGGNMGVFFELISRFADGEASVIKSINPDLPSYSESGEIYKKLRPYIERLHLYNEDINGEPIRKKKLVVVIPGDARNQLLAEELISLGSECGSYGIGFECIRYGALYK